MMDINKAISAQDMGQRGVEGHLTTLPEWSEDIARKLAAQEEITLTDEHWEIIRLLRNHYALHGNDLAGPQLLRALEEPFGARGGRKRLYQLFPRGPVSQGCKLAGLPLPAYSSDPSFGSVE
jgi:TusE/DsrC/DsvC family sulfur relay protein